MPATRTTSRSTSDDSSTAVRSNTRRSNPWISHVVVDRGAEQIDGPAPGADEGQPLLESARGGTDRLAPSNELFEGERATEPLGDDDGRLPDVLPLEPDDEIGALEQ